MNQIIIIIIHYVLCIIFIWVWLSVKIHFRSTKIQVESEGEIKLDIRLGFRIGNGFYKSTNRKFTGFVQILEKSWNLKSKLSRSGKSWKMTLGMENENTDLQNYSALTIISPLAINYFSGIY